MNKAWYEAELAKLTNLSAPAAITTPAATTTSAVMTEAQCKAERDAIEKNYQQAVDDIQ